MAKLGGWSKAYMNWEDEQRVEPYRTPFKPARGGLSNVEVTN